MAFRACPECGATVHDDYVDRHQGWHDDSVQSDIALEPWPDEAPLPVRPDAR